MVRPTTAPCCRPCRLKKPSPVTTIPPSTAIQKDGVTDMKPKILFLSILLALCFFYGCASTRRANPDPPVAETPGWQSEAKTAADAPAESPDAFTEEEEFLFEDELGWEEEDAQAIYTVADPLEPFNRAMFLLNDKLYFWLLKPITQGYRAAVPQPARNAVQNFFVNAAAPIRIINNILQGKGRAAEAEWARFLYNSTAGILGFGNPADAHPGLALKDEDLGQTLAVYGIGDGLFIFWPVLGPSTLRDTVGMVGDYFIDPIEYVEPWELSLGLDATDAVNTLSFRIGDYESLKEAALDPYASFRDAYIQLRQAKIRR